MPTTLESELSDNFEAFVQKLPDLLSSHRGKFALMRHREVIEFFDTARDAFLMGQKTYSDGLFSVQEVTESVADLGFYSYAFTPSEATAFGGGHVLRLCRCEAVAVDAQAKGSDRGGFRLPCVAGMTAARRAARSPVTTTSHRLWRWWLTGR